jgi:hypothetical protein
MKLDTRRMFFLLLSLAMAFFNVQATGEQSSEAIEAETAAISDDVKEMRALLVFVRFRDDVEDSESLRTRGWPVDPRNPTRLPDFAHDLLAPNVSSITDSDITLSRYFYEQSKPNPSADARFLLHGEIHPRNDAGQPIVYVTERPNAFYHRENGRGYGYLVQEVLDNIFTGTGVDPARFDLDADGVLDHVFLIIRSEERHTARGGDMSYSGAAHLGGYGPIGGTPSETPRYWSPSRQDHVSIDWRLSGSFLYTQTQGNIVTHKYHVNLMAHELGHDLWRNHIRSSHIGPVSQNRVPANETGRERRYGYMLMAGAPHTNGGGLLTISAHERALKGWIDLDTLGANSRSVTIGDLYTTSDAYILPLPQRDNRLYVTNHQRIGYFDRIHTNPAFRAPYNSVVSGLMTTGLLVTLSTSPHTLQILPADNRMELAVWFLPEPSPYDGNLFGPESSTQITPWTKPNINGCNGYADDPMCAVEAFALSLAAIDDIRYVNRTSGEMAFEYIEDFRRSPVIRADSWIERRVDGTIEGDLRVTSGNTLTIVRGANVRVTGIVIVEDGARIIVEPGATADFPSTQVHRRGRIDRP